MIARPAVLPGSVAAGLGCRHAVTADAVVALLRQAADHSGVWPMLLAVPDFKRHEPGLLDAARRLGLPLLHVSHDALRAEQPRCVAGSERVLQAVGVRSVAEACALAAAGPGARLVLDRISRNGVTCALAIADKAAP